MNNKIILTALSLGLMLGTSTFAWSTLAEEEGSEGRGSQTPPPTQKYVPQAVNGDESKDKVAPVTPTKKPFSDSDSDSDEKAATPLSPNKRYKKDLKEALETRNPGEEFTLKVGALEVQHRVNKKSGDIEASEGPDEDGVTIWSFVRASNAAKIEAPVAIKDATEASVVGATDNK